MNSKDLDNDEKYYNTSNKGNIWLLSSKLQQGLVIHEFNNFFFHDQFFFISDNSNKSDISVFSETRPPAQPITSPLQENRSLSVLSSENDLEHNISAKVTSHKDRRETTKSSLRRSDEASKIISAFPLLDFMRSPILMIPKPSAENLTPSENFSSNDINSKSVIQQFTDIPHDSNSPIFTTDEITSINSQFYNLKVNGNGI